MQLFDTVAERNYVVSLIAEYLGGLQQSDVPASLLGPSASGEATPTASALPSKLSAEALIAKGNLSEATTTNATEALQPAATKHAAAPRRDLVPDRHR